MILKVLIIQRIFSNYRKPVLDRLALKYKFRLIHAKNNSGISQTSAHYSREVKSFKYGKKETNVYLCVLHQLVSFNPDIVIHEFNPSIISLHISYLYSRLFHKKFIVWGHGYNLSKGFNPNESIKSKIRLWYLKHSNAAIVYGQREKSVLGKYVSEKKIFVAQNTLDTDKLINLRKEFEKLGVESIKKELCIKHKYNLIFIGRLISKKKPELLIELYKRFPLSIKEKIAIHIIGDGELYENIKKLVEDENLKENIFLYGRIDDDFVTGKYLFLSDLAINPGYLGLSVNHSFCFHTPVVSFQQGPKGPFHSPEVEYIIQNETGYLARTNDINDMKGFIISYLENSNIQMFMRDEIDKIINGKASINRMINGFDAAINYLD